MANTRMKMTRRPGAEALVDLAQCRRWFIDLSPTPANVLADADAKKNSNRKMASGVTGTAGQVVYQDTATDLNLAQADAAATAELAGVLLNGASPGQPAEMITEGNYNPGAVVVPGTLYCASAAIAGNIAPIADLGAGEFPRAIGFATTTSNIYVDINNNGGEIPT